jgi:hypothetical protein
MRVPRKRASRRASRTTSGTWSASSVGGTITVRGPHRVQAVRHLHREAGVRVRGAEPAIRELARLLRAPLPVSARGVAMAQVLLTDGGGPLYWSAAPESLHVALRAAIERLDPALPLMAAADGRLPR